MSMQRGHRRRYARLALAGALSAAALTALAPAPALAAEAPTIVNAWAGELTEHSAALTASVNPQGSETAVEFWLECQQATPGRGGCEPVTGGRHTLVAYVPLGSSAVTAKVEMTGLQAGYDYAFRIAAANAAGRTEERPQITFTTDPLGACDKGCPYRTTETLAEIESGEAAAARTVAEQRALEAKEREAREAAAKAAAEAALRKQREEEVAAALREPPPATPTSRCVVPRLKGDTLPGARRALGKAHCRLGKVRWPRHRAGSLRVLEQSVAHGQSLVAGSAVAVTLGRARHG